MVDPILNMGDHIGVYQRPPPNASTDRSAPTAPTPSNPTHSIGPSFGRAALRYSGLTLDSAQQWLHKVTTQGLPQDAREPRPIPNAAQEQVLARIIRRCLEELKEEGSDAEFRSEPLRFVLHGVPGTGKSEVLYWIRHFSRTSAAGRTVENLYTWLRKTA